MPYMYNLKAGRFAQVKTGEILMNHTQNLAPVAANLVAESARLSFLPAFFGPRLMLRAEANLIFLAID